MQDIQKHGSTEPVKPETEPVGQKTSAANVAVNGQHAPRDFKGLKLAAADYLSGILDRLNLDGEYDGDEFVFFAKWRNDNALGSCQFNISKGIGKDFAADTPFDIIELFRLVNQCSKDAAYDQVYQALQELKQSGAAPDARAKQQREQHDEKNRDYARGLWGNKQLVPLEGTLAEQYLGNRSIVVKPDVASSIRYTGRCWHSGESASYPAIILPIKATPTDDDVIAIHRIYLKPDGTKLDKNAKKALGSFHGGGIWFGDPHQTTLYVTEGPENALVALMAGCGLVVSAVSGSNMANIEPPAHIEKIIIIPDIDPNGAGIKAARAAANAYQEYVWVEKIGIANIPKIEGRNKVDLNDVLVYLKIDTVKHAIKSARQHDEITNDDELGKLIDKMNEQWFVIENYHGKFVICEIVQFFDPKTKQHKKRLEMQSEEQWLKKYQSTSIQVGVSGFRPIIKTHGKAWLSHKRHRSYTRAVFEPELEIPPGAYNLWHGFSCEPKQNDEALKPILDFLCTIVCDSDETNYEFLLNLLALGVQQPWLHWETFIACRSKEEGTGKGSFLQIYGSLFGQHFTVISDTNRIIGEFNDVLIDALVVGMDEIQVDTKSAANKFRSTVSEPTIFINPKGYKGKSYDNHAKYILTSNADLAVLSSLTARRPFCLDFSAARANDTAYFDELHKGYNMRGGKEAFLYFLKQRNIRGFNRFAVPETSMLKDQERRSLDIEYTAILHMIEEEDYPIAYNASRRIFKAAVIRDHLVSMFPKLKDVSLVRITEALKRIGAKLVRNVDGKKGGGNGWYLPETVELREQWDNVMFAVKWPQLDTGKLSENDAGNPGF